MHAPQPLSLLAAFADLRQLAQQRQHRGCLILSGTAAWTAECARVLCENLAVEQLACSVVSDRLTQLTYEYRITEPSHLLGNECDDVIFDVYSGFNPETFGIVCGAMRAGSVLILLTPDLETWPDFVDPHANRLHIYPFTERVTPSRYSARLAKRLSETELPHSQHGLIQLLEQTSHPSLLNERSAPATLSSSPTLPSWCLTEDQTRCIHAIEKLAARRARRPLVITADRGRGKSTAVGLAVNSLAAAGKKILITAPGKTAVRTLLKHAGHSAHIQFVAPDALVNTHPAADILIVDEAAAIPTPLLTRLLLHYPRIVFATTQHGYEGSGRGFAIRFTHALDQHTPDWQRLTLTQPVRWAEDDPLEALSHQLLLLDASQSSLESDLPQIQPHDADFYELDRDQLWRSEGLLRSLFGLLVNAHYQTRPSDLRHLLDGSNLRVFGCFSADQLIGAVLLAVEGNLDPAMITAIERGERRPPGHLIPETLISTYGYKDIGSLIGGRIIRIAIAPEQQGNGLGTVCLEKLRVLLAKEGHAYLASSFGAQPDLLRFWQNAGYRTLRLGTRPNKSSGEVSALVFHPLNLHTTMQTDLQTVFFDLFVFQLREYLDQLDSDIIRHIMKEAPHHFPYHEADEATLRAFSLAARQYDVVLPALHRWAGWALSHSRLKQPDAALVIKKILQQRSWQDCASDLNLTGKKAVQTELRAVVKHSLQA